MNPSSPAVRRLAISGLGYLAILAVTGELHWGTGAMVLFGSLWVLQAITALWMAPRTTTVHTTQ